MENKEYDVLIIGAGASGLLAALEIALTGKSVAVIEAKDRVGGRIFTQIEHNLAIELGAEFIHGNLALTKQLLQKAGAKIYPVKGSIWQNRSGSLKEQGEFIEDYTDLEKKLKELKRDKSVAAFLEENLNDEKYAELRFSLKNYVEGYYAARTERASTKAMSEELAKSEDEQYRIEGGYRLLVNYLEENCQNSGVAFFLLHPVYQLHWKKDEVIAVTDKGSIKGRKVLITVPVGVLQKKAITFFPAIPEVTKAFQSLGFGHVVKIVLQFSDAFWKDASITGKKDLADLCFLFSEETIPTWWTHYPKEEFLLTGWLGGPKAEVLQFLNKEEMVQKTMDSLSRVFKLEKVFLEQKLVSAHCYNWSADSHFCGAYSYEVVDGEKAIEFLHQPVEQTIFFAGEGLCQGPIIGTVEGALASGKEAAQKLIAFF